MTAFRIAGKTRTHENIQLGYYRRRFADDLKLLPNARLHTIASTSPERASAFAHEYGVKHIFTRYEDIVRCPNLDVVYIATPHVLHSENALMCLEHGIPVLCEKPFSMNSGEAHRMASAARRNRAFLMEALWTRFIPAFDEALKMIAQGEIGEVHTVKSDFGYAMPFDPAHRVFNKALGGGSLLDIGIYPVLLALFVFGKPEAEDILAAATFARTDVDESCAFTFQYPGNRLAIGHSTIAASTPVEAALYGREGTICLHPRWHHTQRITISKYEGKGQTSRDLEIPYDGWGYHLEAAHVMQCLDYEMLESDKVPLDFTLDLVDTLDAIREKVGLVY